MDVQGLLSIGENLTADARNLVSAFSTSALISGKFDLEQTLKNVLSMASKLKTAPQPTDGGVVQKALYTVDDILEVAAMIPEPYQPILALGAAGVGVLAAAEPDIAAGAEMLFASGKLGEIPDVTKMTEDEIADRFQTVFKVEK